jgi:hypothetical protein
MMKPRALRDRIIDCAKQGAGNITGIGGPATKLVAIPAATPWGWRDFRFARHEKR